MHANSSIKRTVWVGVVLALLVRGAVAWMAGPAGPQEIRYITIAAGILAGEGYTGQDERFPDIIQPPLLPLMLAAAGLSRGPEPAVARGVSVLWGALTVIPVALLTRRLFGARAARRAVLLAAFYPLLAVISGSALTESCFAVLVVSSALLLTTGARAGRVGPRRALIAGLLLGLAFLARPEGLTISIAACAVLFLPGIRGGRANLAGALPLVASLAAGVAILVLPYVLWVHHQTGRWLIAPKAVLFQVYEKIEGEGLREGWTEPPGSDLFHERVRFGLNAERTAIRAHDEYDAVAVGLGGGVLVGADESVSTSGPRSLVAEATRNLAVVYLDFLKEGLVAPPLLLMLAGVGLLSRRLAGAHGRTAAVPLAYLAGSASFLLAPPNPRFLYTGIVLFLPWVARGWLSAESCVIRSLGGGAGPPGDGRSRGARPWRRAVRGLFGIAVVGIMLIHLLPAARESAGRYGVQRDAGLWLGREAGPGRRVMAETPVVTWYAKADFVVLPYAPAQDVLRYARLRGVEYLVVDTPGVERNRPQLRPWLNPWSHHAGIELVRSFRQGRRRLLHVYRVLEPEPGG